MKTNLIGQKVVTKDGKKCVIRAIYIEVVTKPVGKSYYYDIPMAIVQLDDGELHYIEVKHLIA